MYWSKCGEMEDFRVRADMNQVKQWILHNGAMDMDLKSEERCSKENY